MLDSTTMLIFAILAVILTVGAYYYWNPFSYPVLHITIDISRRRSVNYKNEIEQYILDQGIEMFTQHNEAVKDWREHALERANSMPFQKHRLQQLYKTIGENNMFLFDFCRQQTRYKQRNYVKTSYKIDALEKQVPCSYQYILSIYKQLGQIGFETTTAKYNTQNQRKLMTPELRERIKRRDNYTCQICGKYMPDGVGIHVDHIIPISKGGKTVESNLQVTCSVCNLKKFNKLTRSGGTNHE